MKLTVNVDPTGAGNHYFTVPHTVLRRLLTQNHIAFESKAPDPIFTS